MRVTRDQAAANRERVVETAARLFREHGINGIGLADLMNAAGLTHGAFYKQFASKDALVAEACTRAFVDSSANRSATTPREGRTTAATSTQGSLGVRVKRYLSRTHREKPSEGCPAALFGPDVARAGPDVQEAYSDGLQGLVAEITREVQESAPRQLDESQARREALATLAALVGAITLARAVESAAPDFSDELLGTVRKELLSERSDHHPGKRSSSKKSVSPRRRAAPR